MKRSIFFVAISFLSLVTWKNTYGTACSPVGYASTVDALCNAPVLTQNTTCAAGTNVGVYTCTTWGCITAGSSYKHDYFRFTATSTSVDVKVTAGTILNYNINLSSVNPACPSPTTVTQLGCATGQGANGSLTVAGLTIGTQYFIVIQSTTANSGTFNISVITSGGANPCAGCTISGNDICTSANTMTLDGTCCSATNVGMADNWTGTVGCQSADGHEDAWFMGTPTLSTLSITVDGLMGGTTVFWTEAFENGCANGCSANGVNTGNGAWAVTNTGANGPVPNLWFVSCAEDGCSAGGCGVGCGGGANCPANDESLHVGADGSSDCGCLVCPTNDCGAVYDACSGCTWCCSGSPATDKRAESPTINCTGRSGITLNFNYIENGQGSTDNATVWYYNGSTWAQIDDPPKVVLCGGQGTWTARSIALPASANNNPSVKIGFRWVNNADGIGSDPSFAVDDVTLSVVTAAPNAELIVATSSNDLCTGTFTVVNSNCAATPFTLNTTVTPGKPYWWTVSMSDGSTSTFTICADESGGCTATGNDACAGAFAPALDGTCCASTLNGAIDNWAGTPPGCQSGNNPEVWFTGTPGALQTQLVFTVNNLGAGFSGNIELVVVSASGPCSGLTLVGSFCGPSPINDSLQVTPGTQYYWTISSSNGSNGATSTFTICVNDNVYVDNSACNINDVLTPNPPATVNNTYPGGTYPANSTIQFCYTITGWDIGASCNWLAGIVPSWGSGWVGGSFTRTLNPVNASGDMGSWGWWTVPVIHNISGANVNPDGGGWFYCNPDPGTACSGVNTDIDWGDGCIANDWGHFGCNVGCDAVGYAALTWNLCFTLQTPPVASCTAGQDLSVDIKTYADGEIGSWTNIGCMADVATTNGNVQLCCQDNTTALTWNGGNTNWYDNDNVGGCVVPTCTNDITVANTGTNPVAAAGTSYCRNLTINASATFTLNAGSVINICGDFTNNGTFTANAGSKVIFSGSAAQTISGSGTITFADMEILNTSATGVTLSRAVNVSDSLILRDGNIYTTTANLLTMNSGSFSSSGSASSYVSGPMSKAGTTAFVFPVGKGGNWRRIGISTPSASSTFRAEYFNSAYTNVTTMAAAPLPVLLEVSANLYWLLDRTAGTGNCAVSLYWEDATQIVIDDCTAPTAGDLCVARWNGSAWVNENTSGGSITVVGPCASSSGNITSQTVSSFSPFAFGSKTLGPVNPLPVELLNFTALPAKDKVILNWITVSETNNDYFSVERSVDGIIFTRFEIVKGAGNSNERRDYRDYRLKQVDFNGKFTCSPVVPVTLAKTSDFSIMPNPAMDELHVTFTNSIAAETGIKLFNTGGKEVFSSKSITEKGENLIILDLRHYRPGMYFIYLSTGTDTYHSRFVKE
ncbi:MAG: T9SS type A sorting domain-containing protein [Bacteroidetes bacterium]|nr:T9SS type A sorting domain-containing protein [Bacteroidota bacterium]